MTETIRQEMTLRVLPVEDCWTVALGADKRRPYDSCRAPDAPDCTAAAAYCVAYIPEGFVVTDGHRREDPTLFLYRRERHVCAEHAPWKPEVDDESA